MDNRQPPDPSRPPEPPGGPEPSIPPPGLGRWMLAALAVTIAILLVQLYPYRFASGAGPFLGMEYRSHLLVLGQVALFVPLGMVETHLVRRIFGSVGGAMALLVTLDGAILGLICQSAQYWIPARTSSAIDLAANALGTVIGYKLAVLMTKARKA